ncbi:MAG: N-acetylmuramic acid 6-phosphate etherase [Firmicutes bacterium]|nr:N-acetylmuramic acid 6-phosphate etherase [Bacillota bacterium]
MDTEIIVTEELNPRSKNIDISSTEEILKIINDEDKTVAYAVESQIPKIKEAVDIIFKRLKGSGRLFYVGCGTSGRIGILDASECPPTYGTNPEMVQGIIAGGQAAIITAIEGIEDDYDSGVFDISEKNITQEDVVIGITASGRAPYVIGALEYARKCGAATIGISNTKNPLLSRYSDVSIEAVVGPEVIMGSTRMKAGTAQKMILNMISTAVMIKLGKVYQNLMVDLQPNNKKLKERAVRIVMLATNEPREVAEKYLEASHGKPKVAIVAILGKVEPEVALEYLNKSDGFVRRAVEMAKMMHG